MLHCNGDQCAKDKDHGNVSDAYTSCDLHMPVEQVATFKYLGLYFHQSGSTAHLVTPIKSRADGSWAAVQRHHSLHQCGNTINLHLHLLQAILAPVSQYGCQIWGTHSPHVAVANVLALHVNACIMTTSGPFAFFCHPLLASVY